MTGSVASCVVGVDEAAASPACPFNAYSMRRRRASSKSMVSVAVLSKVLSMMVSRGDVGVWMR